MPLLPRSALYPLFGRRIFGWIGHLVDIFAILGTLFGIATSLGLGASQVNAGLNYLYGLPINIGLQTLIIIIITLIATMSVILGLDKGIKILSNVNIIIAVVLMVFILIVGGMSTLIQAFVQNTGMYLSTIVYKTFNLYAYENKQGWLSGWTLFYWGWWIAWSPFVGMFIARVSKGRSIREFLIGVLFVPTGFTFLWMTVFGNSAISIVFAGHGQSLLAAIKDNIPSALFVFLEHFPWSALTSVVALILVVTFFVTSSDSGSLVVDLLATGGARHSIVWQRIFWSLLEGGLAISLLYSGGLLALQTAAIASAFPFLIILFMICISLIKALKEDYLKRHSIETHTTAVQYAKANMPWQHRLDSLLLLPDKYAAIDFMQQVVKPAVGEVIKQLKSNDVDAVIKEDAESIRLILPRMGAYDFVYHVKLKAYDYPDYGPKLREDDDQHYYRAEVYLEHGGQKYDIMGYTEEQVIADIITQYEKHLYFLHVVSISG
ncbi:MAG: BCCT family transporter [Francisellaceae bacterium]